jgi:hypothetical protein
MDSAAVAGTGTRTSVTVQGKGIAVRIPEPGNLRSVGCRPDASVILVDAIHTEEFHATVGKGADYAMNVSNRPAQNGERLDVK